MSPLSREFLPFLKKSFFFASFSDEELESLLDCMSLLSLPKGAVLFRQGDAGDALYLIRSGQVRVIQTEKGQEKVVAHMARGDSLGEISLLSGEPRPNTAVVDATAEFLVLYKKDFDPLLQKMPSVAVHIARVLSRHLLERSRARTPVPFPPRIYGLAAFLPPADRVVFAVNLAISLVEQTRRKVLLLDMLDDQPGVFVRSVGLNPVRVGEASLRQGDLESPEVVRRLTVTHTSGLEFISLPLPLMEGKLFPSLDPFLSLLRRQYDVALVVLPPRPTSVARILLEESDRFLVAAKEALPGEEAALLKTAEEASAGHKIFRVRLTENGPGVGGPDVHARVPWGPGLAKAWEKNRAPFLPPEAGRTQRAMDRLARDLGGFKVGFAMGSGAALGYSLIGMLRVMEKNHLYPDVITGTSMGALIGSFYAAGKSVDELEEIALGITKQKLWSLADVTLPWQGLLLGGRVLKFLKSVLGDVRFEELELPFACVSTDIVSGEEVISRQGKVAEAVRASLSLPFFFQPFFLDGRFLVDGGLVNPVPTSVAAALGANVLLSANLTTTPQNKHLPGTRPNRRRRSSAYWKGPTILEVMAKTLYTMQFEIAQAQSQQAHVLLAPDLSAFTWVEFHRAAEIIRAGEAYMEEAMPKVKALLPLYADHCQIPLRARPSLNPF